MVGKSCLATLGSANSFGIRVCALTNYGQVGVLLREHRGWMLHMAFSYKAKTFRTTAFFPLFKHTAVYFPPARLLWQSTDDQMVQTVRLQKEHISMLSFIQTQRNLLSPDVRRSALSLQNGELQHPFAICSSLCLPIIHFSLHLLPASNFTADLVICFISLILPRGKNEKRYPPWRGRRAIFDGRG